MLRHLSVISLAITMLVITQACAPAAAPSASPVPATASVATSAKPSPSPLGSANIRTAAAADGRYCYLYLGVKKGFFTARGLDVTIDEGTSGTQVLQTVGAGRDFMGSGTVNLIPVVRSQGALLKVVAILEQENAAGVVVHGAGTITSVSQLAGKSINVGPGDGFTLLAPFLKANGVDPASVQINNTDHATKLQAFLAGKADAAAIFSSNELPLIQKVDPQARFFPYSKVFSMYGLGLVVTDKTITDRPQAVSAAVAGVLDAEKFAIDHPNECVDALVSSFPDRQFDKAVALAQAQEHQKLVLAAGKEQIGKMTDARWKDNEDTLVKYFDFKPTGKPISDYSTSKFLPDQ